MNSLLKQQLEKNFGRDFNVPEEWRNFVSAISDAYTGFDDYRVTLERSLDLSSHELLQANSEMRAIFDAIPDLLLRLDQEGNILDFKASAHGDFVLQQHIFFGKRIQDIPVKQISSQFLEAIARVTKEKNSLIVEFSLVLQESEYFYEARLIPLFGSQIVVIVRNITERKASEAAIQERLKLEDRLSKLAATAPGVIHAYRLRPDGTACFPYASPSIENIYGLKPEDLVQDAAPALKRVHPDDVPRLISSVQKSAAAMSLWREEFRVNHPQKGMIWVEGCSSPVREPDRSILWHGFLLDITDRKKTEEELRQTVSLLQSTFNSTADGLLVADRAGRIITFNERFASLWQMSKEILATHNEEKAIAHAVSQLKNPDDFLRKVRELYSTPEAECFDMLEFKDGRVFERYSCPQRMDGKPIGRVWSFRDVTATTRSKELLLKLSRAVEQTAESVFITDLTGTIEYVNPAFEAMTGYTREEVIGKTPRILKSGQHNAELYANLWNTILSGRTFSGVLVNRRKNGELYYSEKTICPVKDGENNVTHFVSTERDITERKELEARFRQSQKMEAFGQLAAGVAHDFNNILTVIQGHASLLQTGQLSEPDQYHAMTEISRAADRATNLTRQLLTFSRRQPMQSKDLDLNEVVANITKMLQRLIGEDIALETRYAPGGSPIHADSGMMEQVLMNLAVNSRDAMPKGGRLIIETAPVTLTDTTQFTKHIARPGEFVHLSVTDTGTGVAPQHLPHLFEPFFTTKEVGKGTGLGLATVFGIVEQHHGWIDVESKVNAGTTFHVYFPRLPKKIPDQGHSSPVAKVPGGTETILLVEDETALRLLVQRVLERHGYHIYAAASGIQALEIWRAHRSDIDIVVSDMVMPEGMNGRELGEHLRMENPDLKIIYCSGYTDEMLGEDSPLRNNGNFLEKPFNPEVLLQRVRECLDETQPR